MTDGSQTDTPPADVRRADTTTAVVPAPSAEPAASEWPEDEFQREAERYLLRAIFRGSAVGVPVFVVLYIGLVALAVGGLGYRLGPVLWMGAIVGLVAGVFFGGWAGFVQSVEKLEEAQQRAHRGD